MVSKVKYERTSQAGLRLRTDNSGRRDTVIHYNRSETMSVQTRFVVPGGDMLFSGYIFDVEGTLVDSVRQNLLGLQETLEDFGVSVPYNVLQLYSGLDGDQTLQLVAPDLNVGERKKILAAQGKLYEAKYLQSVKAFAGVRQVFEAL